MARAVVRKSGKVGRARAYRAVSRASLVKMDGVEELLDAVSERLDNLEITVLKDAWVRASQPLLRSIRTNISALPVENRTKEVLQASLSVAAGPENKPNVLVGMSQAAGKRKLAGRFIFNPYWVEFGTARRSHKTGKATGSIRATPFFRPGVTASRPALREALAAQFKALLVEEE